MIIANCSVITKASKVDVWELYVNISTWPKWDKDIEYTQLHGNEFIHSS